MPLLMYLLELLFGAIVLVMVVTQVAVPLWRGTKLFPLFRSKRREVAQQFRSVREDLDLAAKEAELKQAKREVKQVRRSTQETP